MASPNPSSESHHFSKTKTTAQPGVVVVGYLPKYQRIPTERNPQFPNLRRDRTEDCGHPSRGIPPSLSGGVPRIGIFGNNLGSRAELHRKKGLFLSTSWIPRGNFPATRLAAVLLHFPAKWEITGFASTSSTPKYWGGAPKKDNGKRRRHHKLMFFSVAPNESFRYIWQAEKARK